MANPTIDTGGGLIFAPTTDAELLKNLATESYKANYLHLWEDNGAWYLEHSFSIGVLEKEIQNIDNQFFIIYKKQDNHKNAVGFLKIRPDFEYADALELERIYLLKTASGKGIGAAAMDYVSTLARAQGYVRIRLKAMDSSAGALRFYEKMGFERVGEYVLPYERIFEPLRGMYILEKWI